MGVLLNSGDAGWGQRVEVAEGVAAVFEGVDEELGVEGDILRVPCEHGGLGEAAGGHFVFAEVEGDATWGWLQQGAAEFLLASGDEFVDLAEVCRCVLVIESHRVAGGIWHDLSPAWVFPIQEF